jgi:hypothetical protein
VKCRQVLVRVTPVPEQPSGLGIEKSAGGAQKTRLPGPVRARDVQAATAWDRETNAPQHVALATPQVQIFDFEAFAWH